MPVHPESDRGRREIPEDLDAHEIGAGRGYVVAEGVLVSAVVAGAPAAQAGVKVGDVLEAVAGRPVRSPEQLLERVAALVPDRPTSLRVLRGNKALELQVNVGVRPVAGRPGARAL